MQTMFVESLERRVILVHSDRQPSMDEWSELLDFSARSLDEGRMLGLFVLTESVGPDARQRKLLSDMWKRFPMPPIAVVTPSAAVRAIVTAVNFFSAQPMRTFHPDDRREAFEHIGLQDLEQAEAVLQRLRALAAQGARRTG